MRLDDEYPGEWEDRRRSDETHDAIASIILMGWWLIPLGTVWIVQWVKSLF